MSGREVWLRPEADTCGREIPSTEESGFPYYSTFRIVVKKTERPIWIPVTRGEAVTILLSNAKKALAEFPPEARAQVREEAKADVACLEAGLAKLAPGERGAAAYISLEPRVNRQEGCTMMVDASHRYARGLVRENPDFYDKSLPATAIQVLVLDFAGIQYPPRSWHHPVVEKLRDEMDYAALAAMIAGK